LEARRLTAATIHVDQLVDCARERTGLVDFGDDAMWEGLDVLVSALNHEAELNDVGRQGFEDTIVDNLANRLRVTDWLTRHPRLLRAPVERPVVIIGPMRSGTTLLSRLLHQDPGLRSLMKWEALNSVPPPDAATFERDPRIQAAKRGERILNALNPGIEIVNESRADAPTECIEIFSQDYKCYLWDGLARVPTYGAWLRNCDYTSAYAYHRRVLQLLQSRAPGRWSLKSPAHRLAIDVLAQTYPDALFIETHRDPVTVVASTCSLVYWTSRIYTDADHRPYIAEHWTDVVEQMADRVNSFRDEHGDARFLDVHYAQLVRDPIAVMRRVYSFLGRELTDSLEAAMRAYITANPQGKHGRHVYRLRELCLDRAELEGRFATHVARYDIPREGVA
jgi:hypothetical protein